MISKGVDILKIKTRNIILTGIYIAFLLIVQAGLYPMTQFTVGSIVNFILIMALLTTGLPEALLVGIISPIAATIIGINKLPMMIPTIIIANMTLVIIYFIFKKKEILSAILAPIAKFIVIFLLARLTLHFFMPNAPDKVVKAFSAIQLFTAYTGTIAAYLFNGIIKKVQKITDYLPVIIFPPPASLVPS